MNAKKAILNVAHSTFAVKELTQLTIREILCEKDINDILHNRKELGDQLKENLGHLKDSWGIIIEAVQIRDIKFDASMVRAMAKKAEAVRSAEAKIINADADVETAKKYDKAAKIYKENPVSLRLRELYTLNEVSKNGNNTYFIPTSVLDTVSHLFNKKK